MQSCWGWQQRGRGRQPRAFSFERGAVFRGAAVLPHRSNASRLYKPQPEQIHHKLPLVEEREFGFAVSADGEDDWSFDQARAVAQEFAKKRRLKGIAARREMFEIAVGNQIGADHAIARRCNRGWGGCLRTSAPGESPPG